LITLRSEALTIIEWYEDILRKVKDYPKYLRSISDLGQRFSERTFGNIDSKMDLNARGIALDYAKYFGKVKSIDKNGLAFVGDYGVGKTHLAAAISNYLIDNCGVTVCFGTQVELLDKIRGEMSFNRDETKHKMKTLDLLVLDDFGKEKPSEWTDQILFEVINARYERKLPIIITTNMSAQQLIDKYGNAVMSRLTECCRWVNVQGSNRREEL